MSTYRPIALERLLFPLLKRVCTLRAKSLCGIFFQIIRPGTLVLNCWWDPKRRECNVVLQCFWPRLLISYKCKKLQFIHTVNGDGSKTAKIIKGNVNHTNIAWMSMLVWLTLPFYDFCGFRSLAVNSVYKLQFFTFIFAVLLPVLSRLLIMSINTTFFDFSRWQPSAI